MGFLVLAWRPADADSADLAGRLCAGVAGDARWREAGRTDASALWVGAGVAPAVSVLPGGGGYLVGRLSAPPGASSLPKAWLDRLWAAGPEAACRRLLGGAWGSYLALFLDGTAPWQAFRDPSGAVDAYAWRRGRVQVVASGIHDLPPGLLPDRIALDWDSLLRILQAPSLAALECPLEDVRPLRPGVLERLETPGRAGETLWSPALHVARVGPPPAEASGELVRCVDAAVAGLAAGHDRILVELSGGLDSAIVGSALVAAGEGARAAGWVNYFDHRAVGDERAYARAVAARLGARLTEVPLVGGALSAGDFAEASRTVRPPVSGVNRFYDTDLARRAAEADATAILSGHGGDAAFYQMPTPLLIADALRREGWRSLGGGLVGGLARRTRQPAWSVLRAALWPAKGLRLPPPLPGLRPGGETRLHPWLVEAADAPPAKRLQIASLAQAHLYAEDSARRRAAEVLQPLFAQPVIELVLSIPAPVLAAGGRDRALARLAFADRLPPEIVARRSKGALDGYYTDVVLESLDWLRPHLLDGCLCDAGVIDRDVLSGVLTAEHLVWRGQAVAILVAALVESWVRWWQGRVPGSSTAPRHRPKPLF